jgi:hypothetical protein
MLNDTTTLNQFQVHALLIDTITHLKFKQHMHRNFKSAKSAFCSAKGIKTSVSSWTLLTHIGQVYKENGLLDKFVNTCDKLGYPVDLG